MIKPFIRPATAVRLLSAAGLLLAGAYLPGARAAEDDGKSSETPGAITLSVDNDLFGSGLDRHYTQGMRISWLPAPASVPDWVQDGVQLMPTIDSEDEFTFVFSAGQNMYTPENISRETPDPDDRPYAGWLYASVGAVALDSKHNLQHNVALDLGVVGPWSMAGKTQRFWHELIGSTKPRGWDHQLSNEPGVVLTYGARLREPLTVDEGLGNWLETDFTPRAGFSLGNVFTHGAVGATLRIGRNLDLDFGPPFIRPSLPGAGLVKRRDAFGWYFFVGAEGRAIARNIFLDGNTFEDSPRVDKVPFVGDFQAGVAVTFKRTRLSFTQILRTREFETQNGISHYGSISLTYLF